MNANAGQPVPPLTPKSTCVFRVFPIDVLVVPIPNLRNEKYTGSETTGQFIDPFQIRATIS